LRGRPLPSGCREGRCMRRRPGNESANTQRARHGSTEPSSSRRYGMRSQRLRERDYGTALPAPMRRPRLVSHPTRRRYGCAGVPSELAMRSQASRNSELLAQMWHAHMATVDVAVGRDSVWDLGRAVKCRGLTTRCGGGGGGGRARPHRIDGSILKSPLLTLCTAACTDEVPRLGRGNSSISICATPLTVEQPRHGAVSAASRRRPCWPTTCRDPIHHRHARGRSR
jgi:hypothetical protein